MKRIPECTAGERKSPETITLLQGFWPAPRRNIALKRCNITTHLRRFVLIWQACAIWFVFVGFSTPSARDDGRGRGALRAFRGLGKAAMEMQFSMKDLTRNFLISGQGLLQRAFG